MGYGSPSRREWTGGWQWACYIKVTAEGVASQMYGTMHRSVSVGSNRNRQTYDNSYWGEMALPGDRGVGPWFESFVLVMNFSCMRDNHWSINVTDGKNKVSYSIPQNDAPRMFKARDKDGKKIFHAVASHIRKDGTIVKQHYRGNRKFTLDGLDVTIQIPGKHRGSLLFVPAFVEEGSNEPSLSVEDAAPIFGMAMER